MEVSRKWLLFLPSPLPEPLLSHVGTLSACGDRTQRKIEQQSGWAAWRGWDLRPGRQPGLGVDFHSLILCPGLSLSLGIIPFTPMLLWALNLEPRTLTSRKNTKTVMWLPGET